MFLPRSRKLFVEQALGAYLASAFSVPASENAHLRSLHHTYYSRQSADCQACNTGITGSFPRRRNRMERRDRKCMGRVPLLCALLPSLTYSASLSGCPYVLAKNSVSSPSSLPAVLCLCARASPERRKPQAYGSANGMTPHCMLHGHALYWGLP